MRLLPHNRKERIRVFFLLGLMAVMAFFYGGNTVNALSRAPAVYGYFRYTPQEGDVVFQSLPHGDLVDAIEGITHSPFSHCGVVLQNGSNQWVVEEAIFNVHETPLFLWEVRGRNGGFTAYRPDAKYAASLPEFKKQLLVLKGLPYDFDYDMTKTDCAYCSSLVYQAFEKATGEKMGRLEKLRDLDWKPFEPFIKSEQGGGLPLDRIMITPASLAQASQLHQVYP